jgi:hypothetical protein
VRNAYAAVGIGDPDTDCDGFEDWEDEDNDDDGLSDSRDNCGNVPNPRQEDMDGDGYGDACDNDADGDWQLDATDNCLLIYNPNQADWDSNGVGEACQDDEDGFIELKDYVYNASPTGERLDNCQFMFNPQQENHDLDQDGDVCDPDDDNDGILDDGNSTRSYGDPYCTGGNTKNCDDNAPFVSNTTQRDDDVDGVGDVVDNCLSTQNPYLEGVYPPVQANLDGDEEGDACDGDMDGDDVPNSSDNCDFVYNPDQINLGGNANGLACDEGEVFMLSLGSSIFEIEVPSDVPLVVPIFPCLGEGCPDPASTFPERQVFSIFLAMPQALPIRLLDEYGAQVAKDLSSHASKLLTFEVHPAYRFDLDWMAATQSSLRTASTTPAIDPLKYIQRPLYFLEIWPGPDTVPGEEISISFTMFGYLEGDLRLPIILR